MSAVPSFSAAVSRIQIVDAARAWLGTPYVHQASAKGAGCDCLGLVRGVWRGLYGGEPEAPPAYTPDWPERVFARENQKGRVFARENQKERVSADEDEPLLAAARRNMIERDGKDVQPGDVLIFRIAADGPAKHCGIVSAPDRFIHAYAGRAVIETWLNRWWRARIAGVFVFPGAE